MTKPATSALTPHDPDSISIIWRVDDVLGVRPDLTKKQARQVLAAVKRRHDASIGVNWDVIGLAADDLFPKPKPAETPWGFADHVTEIAPGIVSYSTPSHGGIHLSAARLAAMPKALREFKTWAGPGWYEEDCDWAVVALAFPQFFKPEDREAAAKTLKGYKPELYEQYLAAGRGKGGV